MSFGKRLAYGGADRRKSPRVADGRPATIRLPDGRSLPCKVVDRSETGAKLAMTTLLGLPDRFHVHQPSMAPRAAVVIRKETGRVAVRFVD